MRTSLATLAGFAVGFSAFPADAHVILTSHITRHGQSAIKAGPCGLAGGTRSENVYTYRPGDTITLEWDEFIFHPGYFRVSFDDDGDDSFVDPPSFEELAVSDTILADGLFNGHTSADGPIFSQQITLPNVECDNCTLQLIQLMTDKPPYVAGTNDIYYNCVDLVLTADPKVPVSPTEPHDGVVVRDIGCRVGTPVSDDNNPLLAGLAALSVLGVSLLLRRRSA